MNPSDVITLLQIAKSKIDKGATFEERVYSKNTWSRNHG